MADIDASLICFCREIRKGATVALSGECADEIFGGYPWFHREELLDADTFPWSRSHPPARLLARSVAPGGHPPRRIRRRSATAKSLAEVPHLPGESPRERRMREMSPEHHVVYGRPCSTARTA